MNTKDLKKSLAANIWSWILPVAGLAFVVFLMLYRLGSLINGVSSAEIATRSMLIGLHGIYHNPLNLPLNGLRSLDYKFFHPTTQTLLRLPNAIIGGVTIIAFYYLAKLWYSTRIAIATSLMFATSAWTLHISRLASNNIDYMAGVTFFILSTAILHRYSDKRYVHSLINLLWGLMLYIPGIAWLVVINGIRQHKQIGKGFKLQKSFLSVTTYILSILIPLPLLVNYLIKSPKHILAWLALPSHLPDPATIAKQFGGVFVHILIRGPQYPNLWLGRQPILDIFCLVALVLGAIFYITHLSATRSHLLIGSFIVGLVLISISGGIDLSFLVPVIFLFIAAGIAYLLQQWLAVFPKNPFARYTGYILISAAVAVSCLYGLRSYFVAWPHNPQSQAVFDKKLPD